MAKVNAIPEGMHSITPHLVCAGAADAIDFYKKAFGATEEMRLPGPDGKLMHGAVRIEGSVVMLVDENPQWGAFGPKALKGSPVTSAFWLARWWTRTATLGEWPPVVSKPRGRKS